MRSLDSFAVAGLAALLVAIFVLFRGSSHPQFFPYVWIAKNSASFSSAFALKDDGYGKVESSLIRARASIRKSTYLPNSTYSKIYRNAPAFYRSHSEMEKRFKIFVYREGEPPLVHWGPCSSIYSTEGRFIQQLELAESPFVTSDPDSAHVFFLPFSVTMMVTFAYNPKTNKWPKVRRFVTDYVDLVANKYPYWNRSLGADHFMLSCHDWGPMASMANPFLYNNSIRVLCNANSSEGFNPAKDAALPEMYLGRNEYSILTKHLYGGKPALERTILAFFAGGNHGVVRPLLFQHWHGRDPDIPIYEHLPRDHGHRVYRDFMNKSRYCVCPSGYEVASPRIVEAIYSECVPVIISESYVLPFSDVLNWEAFSLSVPLSDIPKLKEILQSIPQEIYVKLQANVKEVKKHFLINQPPKRYDMFHMIIHSVWLRRLNTMVRK